MTHDRYPIFFQVIKYWVKYRSIYHNKFAISILNTHPDIFPDLDTKSAAVKSFFQLRKLLLTPSRFIDLRCLKGGHEVNVVWKIPVQLQNVMSLTIDRRIVRNFNVHADEDVSYTHLRAHETPEHL